MIKAKIEIL